MGQQEVEGSTPITSTQCLATGQAESLFPSLSLFLSPVLALALVLVYPDPCCIVDSRPAGHRRQLAWEQSNRLYIYAGDITSLYP